MVFNILVPADLIDNGDLIFTDSSINGGVYLKREWEPITVYGNDYYYASTPTMYDEEIYNPVSVVLTCYKEIDGESEIVSASYEFDLEYYVNYIINAEEGTYEADAIEYAEELYDMFFADDVVDDDPVILPDDEENGDGEEDLEDEEVPLADVPETGDMMGLWMSLFGTSGVGLFFLTRKRKEEEAE